MNPSAWTVPAGSAAGAVDAALSVRLHVRAAVAIGNRRPGVSRMAAHPAVLGCCTELVRYLLLGSARGVFGSGCVSQGVSGRFQEVSGITGCVAPSRRFEWPRRSTQSCQSGHSLLRFSSVSSEDSLPLGCEHKEYYWIKRSRGQLWCSERCFQCYWSDLVMLYRVFLASGAASFSEAECPSAFRQQAFFRSIPTS